MILLENLNWPYYHDEKCPLKQGKSHALLEHLSCPCNHEVKFSRNTQDLMKWFENMNYPYYHERKCSQKWVIYAELNWRTARAITRWNFCSKNSFDDVTRTFELALLSRAKIFAKIGSLDDATQKFDLPLLSQAEIFHKIKQFWWFHLEVWTGLIIMR